MLKAVLTDLMQRIPGKASPEWPSGEPFTLAFAHGTMSVEVYAPEGTDIQTPHDQDELYFIHSGHGEIVVAGERHAFEPGMVFFCSGACGTSLREFLTGFCHVGCVLGT